MRKRLIIASNRLPISIVEQSDGGLSVDRSLGGLATALDSIFHLYKPFWVGWTGLRRELSSAQIADLDLPARLIPVQAPAAVIEKYYDRVANSVLWPMLHSLETTVVPTEADWQALREMSTHFATAIQSVIQPDSVIWLHDYLLMMLPSALRRAGVQNRIGFFCHTTFPPAARFMALPQAKELLENACETDVFGLQSKRDVDHFKECLQTARLSKRPGTIQAFPIGIDFAGYQRGANAPAVRKLLSTVKAEHRSKRIILSVARLDYSKGIVDQLRIVEQFLANHPQRTQFVYKLVVAPSRESVAAHRVLRDEIASVVKEVTRHLASIEPGWEPIEYAYQSFNFEEMIAWFRAADVLLLAPKADGMNLIAKEYVAARPDDDGVLIISKAMGAAFQLKDALQFEAGDIDTGARRLEQAFSMQPAERQKRWQQMRANVQTEDVFWWADNFLKALMAE